MKSFDIEKVMSSLSLHKPIFHSEDDLQGAFANEVRKLYTQAKVEREIPYYSVLGYSDDEEKAEYSKSATKIDILISLDNDLYLVELKYKTKPLIVDIDSQIYSLKEHSALNDNRYRFLHDVNRLEDYIVNEYNGHVIKEAYAIFITNNAEYQKEKKENSVIKDFDLSKDKAKTGVLCNKNNPKQTVFLAGEYIANWSEYSRVPTEKNNIFWISIYKVNWSYLK